MLFKSVTGMTETLRIATKPLEVFTMTVVPFSFKYEKETYFLSPGYVIVSEKDNIEEKSVIFMGK